MAVQAKNYAKGSEKVKKSRYDSMIDSALVALHSRKGVSRQAIEKYIVSNYTVGARFRSDFKIALKKGVASGDIIQTKGAGANGSLKRKISPPTIPAIIGTTIDGKTTVEEPNAGETIVTAPKKRGRPKKAKKEGSIATTSTNIPKRKLGRPKKVKKEGSILNPPVPLSVENNAPYWK